MKILLVASECAPFAKTGGLADVVGSLCKELAHLGHDVRVMIPNYQRIKDRYNLQYIKNFEFYLGFQKKYCGIAEYKNDGVIYYFIDNNDYFYRANLYSYGDDGERFAYFDNAVLLALQELDFFPDVIHLNDWQTGMIPLLLRLRYQYEERYKKIKILYSIHNIQYQGVFSPTMAPILNLNYDSNMEFDHQINFMKSAIVASDIINTVSSSYRDETLTPQYGYGLEGILKMRANDYIGIVNGLDYTSYNPETDPRIYKNYSSKAFIKAKAENKKEFIKEFNYRKAASKEPLIAVVSRLADQKGFDLLMPIMDDLLTYSDMNFFLLGNGDSYYEHYFKDLELRYPDRVKSYIGYNDTVAQKAYAASDIFLMPSRFEPCGLGQMIAMRYGSLPLVRLTGGLKDTVIPYPLDQADGFGFDQLNATQCKDTIYYAINTYHNDSSNWKKMIERAMKKDFSWNQSAKKYVEIYEKMCEEN